MLTALRAQVQAVLYALPAKRKPALRRSDAPDALLATDLPLIAEEEAVRRFIGDMTTLGWTVKAQQGWLTLDAPIPMMDTAVPEALQGECGCCIAILLRHAEDDALAEGLLRAAVKAADAGRQPFERWCAALHGELAARLRRREAMPGALLPCLCHAHETFYK